MNKKGQGLPLNTIIIAILMIIVLLMLIIFIDGKMNPDEYDKDRTYDELSSKNWSGNINDLNTCHILIWYSQNKSSEPVGIHFNWIDDCEMVKQHCEQPSKNGYCYFKVKNQLTASGNSNWKLHYDGTCYCHIGDRNYKNMILDN